MVASGIDGSIAWPLVAAAALLGLILSPLAESLIAKRREDWNLRKKLAGGQSEPLQRMIGRVTTVTHAKRGEHNDSA